MGIVNVTKDSFYANSRANSEKELISIIEKHIEEGAAMIDIGAMSTRPGAVEIPLNEEVKAIEWALKIVKEQQYKVLISVDTYRYAVAKMAIDMEVDFINDISCGDDLDLIKLVAALDIGYIGMHKKGMPNNMQENPNYINVVEEIAAYFIKKNKYLTDNGINNWIIDPGFGFGKTIAHNYLLLKNLSVFKKFLNQPLIVGISRKGMIYKPLGISASDSLNGTTAAHALALMGGANVLRVHDTQAAMQAIKIVEMYQANF